MAVVVDRATRGSDVAAVRRQTDPFERGFFDTQELRFPPAKRENRWPSRAALCRRGPGSVVQIPQRGECVHRFGGGGLTRTDFGNLSFRLCLLPIRSTIVRTTRRIPVGLGPMSVGRTTVKRRESTITVE